MALSRTQRIHGARNVTDVFKGARPFRSGPLSVRVLREGRAPTVFAVTVPVTVGTAVRRNASRRRVTAALRSILATRSPVAGARVVVTVHEAVADAAGLTDALVKLLEKSGILQQ